MTALVVGSATAGGCMPFSALALVECAQAATVFIADRLPEVMPHNVLAQGREADLPA